MKKVKIYSFELCSYCQMAKGLLDALNIKYEEIVITREELEQLEKKTQMQTVPQIFIEDELIGGFDELNKLHKEGKLKEKIK